MVNFIENNMNILSLNISSFPVKLYVFMLESHTIWKKCVKPWGEGGGKQGPLNAVFADGPSAYQAECSIS